MRDHLICAALEIPLNTNTACCRSYLKLLNENKENDDSLSMEIVGFQNEGKHISKNRIDSDPRSTKVGYAKTNDCWISKPVHCCHSQFPVAPAPG